MHCYAGAQVPEIALLIGILQHASHSLALRGKDHFCRQGRYSSQQQYYTALHCTVLFCTSVSVSRLWSHCLREVQGRATASPVTVRVCQCHCVIREGGWVTVRTCGLHLDVHAVVRGVGNGVPADLHPGAAPRGGEAQNDAQRQGAAELRLELNRERKTLQHSQWGSPRWSTVCPHNSTWGLCQVGPQRRKRREGYKQT